MHIRWLYRKRFSHLPIRTLCATFNLIIFWFLQPIFLTLFRDDVSMYSPPMESAKSQASDNETGRNPFFWKYYIVTLNALVFMQMILVVPLNWQWSVNSISSRIEFQQVQVTPWYFEMLVPIWFWLIQMILVELPKSKVKTRWCQDMKVVANGPMNPAQRYHRALLELIVCSLSRQL